MSIVEEHMFTYSFLSSTTGVCIDSFVSFNVFTGFLQLYFFSGFMFVDFLLPKGRPDC